MKHLILTTLLISISIFSQAQTPTKAGAIEMNKQMFIEKVCDFTANKPPQWKYIGNRPCIIDFYTTWCGPCKRLAPILNELAKEYNGQIYIYKVDCEKERELAALFGVSSYPTLVFCPIDGNPQLAKGALPKATLIEAINTVLLKKQPTPTTK